MKPVKAWEALKAWQEEGRKCRPEGYGESWNFCQPNAWPNFALASVFFELEPPKPQVVEFEAKAVLTSVCDEENNDSKQIIFECDEATTEKLDGKRWRVTCAEIVDEEFGKKVK